MSKNRYLKIAAVAVAALAITGPAVALNSPNHAAVAPPAPVGLYSDGVYRACVQTAAPNLFKPHTGVRTKACPTGTRLLTLNQQGPSGEQGVPGPVGATGPQGDKGDQGEEGAKGDKGNQGDKGNPGDTGPTGPQGPAGAAAPVAVYGTGLVNISRGGGAAATWATATTAISAADGGTASNTFRMTCSTANAPCVISAQAKATDAAKVYPRLLIQKSDINIGAPVGLCEYADGTANSGEVTANIGATPADLTLGIGGSLDCGSTQVRPASGAVDSITVPAGYYDIAATFGFTR